MPHHTHQHRDARGLDHRNVGLENRHTQPAVHRRCARPRLRLLPLTWCVAKVQPELRNFPPARLDKLRVPDVGRLIRLAAMHRAQQRCERRVFRQIPDLIAAVRPRRMARFSEERGLRQTDIRLAAAIIDYFLSARAHQVKPLDVKRTAHFDDHVNLVGGLPRGHHPQPLRGQIDLLRHHTLVSAVDQQHGLHERQLLEELRHENDVLPQAIRPDILALLGNH